MQIYSDIWDDFGIYKCVSYDTFVNLLIFPDIHYCNP